MCIHPKPTHPTPLPIPSHQVQNDYHTPELHFAGALLSRLSPPSGLAQGEQPPKDDALRYWAAHIDSESVNQCVCVCGLIRGTKRSGSEPSYMHPPTNRSHCPIPSIPPQRPTSAPTISAPSSTSTRRTDAPAPPPPGKTHMHIHDTPTSSVCLCKCIISHSNHQIPIHLNTPSLHPSTAPAARTRHASRSTTGSTALPHPSGSSSSHQQQQQQQRQRRVGRLRAAASSFWTATSTAGESVPRTKKNTHKTRPPTPTPTYLPPLPPTQIKTHKQNDHSVSPIAGRMVSFTSGFENPHQVQPVTGGKRYALSVWFTTDRADAYQVV